MAKSLLAVATFDRLLCTLDARVQDAAPLERRVAITEAVGAILRERLGPEVEVHAMVDAEHVTHFDIACSGIAGVMMHDDETAVHVRSFLTHIRERYAHLLNHMPADEVVEHTAALSDDDLRAQARALRGSKR